MERTFQRLCLSCCLVGSALACQSRAELEAAVSSIREADAGEHQACTGEYIDDHSAPCTPTFAMEDFVGAQTCAGCHPTHFEEWRESPHGRAMRDPVFQALVRRKRKTQPGTERFCTMCHTALGTRSREVTPGFEFDALGALSMEGVTCETCHRAVDVVRTHNAGLVVDPDVDIRGPELSGPPLLSRAEGRGHGVEVTTLLSQAELCGSCHDVRTPAGLDLETPYREWQDSPAAKDGRTCQSCHMPSYKGTVAPFGQARAKLHRHAFESVSETHASAEDRTSHSLVEGVLSLSLTATAGSDRMRVTVDVENLLDGHSFPTGSDFNRQCWLEVQIEDASGALVFESGTLDEAGNLRDRFAPKQARDKRLEVLSAYLLDADGKPTLFTSEAEKLERHAIEAGKRERFDYDDIDLGGSGGPWKVRVRALFRSYSPRLLAALDLLDSVPEPTLVEIDSAALTVSAEQ